MRGPWREGRWTAAPLAALASVLVLGSCGRTPSPTPSSSPATSASPVPSALKPVLRGLLDRNGPPPAAYVASMGGFVVNAHWSDLQPAQGAPLAANNVIDQAIDQVRSLNATYHVDLGLKIRLDAGIWAPQWVKEIGGPPIPVTDPPSGESGTIGRFWTTQFGAAYDQLEAELAARYDSVSEVREVTISRCTTVFAEPFIRDTGDPAVVEALLGAGYSLAADEACQQQEVQAQLVWHHTSSDLSFNPYQTINADGSTGTDEAFTQSMMQYCRHVLGRACVLENNSLRFPEQATYVAMYAAMSALGSPIAIQTATAARVGDLQDTLAEAVAIGASSVELPGGYESLGSPASFAGANHSLAVNSTT